MVAIAELPKPLCDVLRCTRMARTLPEDQKAIGARSRVVSVFPSSRLLHARDFQVHVGAPFAGLPLDYLYTEVHHSEPVTHKTDSVREF